MTTLLERLKKRAAQDLECSNNAKAIAQAFSAQMEAFERRDGSHNTYAVRMAVDHINAARREEINANDLNKAIELIEKARTALDLIAKGEETYRYDGDLVIVPRQDSHTLAQDLLREMRDADL